jgi:hypothetical protein
VSRPCFRRLPGLEYKVFSTFFITANLFIVIFLAGKHRFRASPNLDTPLYNSGRRAPRDVRSHPSSQKPVTDAFENLSPFSNSVVTK